MWKSRFTWLVAYFFCVLFLYSAVSKFREYSVFQDQIRESPILKSIAGAIAWLVPVAEIVIAILLFIPSTTRKGLFVSLVLMILFTAYIITLYTINTELPCSCGGLLDQLSWQQHLIFNTVCIAMLIYSLRLSKVEVNKINNPADTVRFT